MPSSTPTCPLSRSPRRYGLPVAFAFGVFVSWMRLRWSRRHALRRFMSSNPDMKTSPKLVYRFFDMYEAEIISRVCRTYTKQDDEVVDPRAIKLANFVIRVGMAHFPTNFFMVFTFSNFLLEVEGNYQSGASQLQQGKKIASSLADRYAIFVREQV